MPTVEHVALWVKDLERERVFFERYFGATLLTETAVLHPQCRAAVPFHDVMCSDAITVRRPCRRGDGP